MLELESNGALVVEDVFVGADKVPELDEFVVVAVEVVVFELEFAFAACSAGLSARARFSVE